MCKDYKNKCKYNFTKLFGVREGFSIFSIIICAFVGNLVTIAAWFVLLLYFVKVMVMLGLVPVQYAGLYAIILMYILAIAHFIVFSFTKFGERIFVKFAEMIEQAFSNAFMLAESRYSPLVIVLPEFSDPFFSHISPVPCAPPRLPLTPDFLLSD